MTSELSQPTDLCGTSSLLDYQDLDLTHLGTVDNGVNGSISQEPLLMVQSFVRSRSLIMP